MTAGVLPRDVEAELSVLGGIILRPTLLAQLVTLEVDDFWDPSHKALFGAMRNLEAAYKPLDHTLLMDSMAAAGHGDAVGVVGVAALRVPTPDNVMHYVEIVKRHRATRDLMLAASDFVQRCYDGANGVEAVDALTSTIGRITAGRGEERGKRLGDLIRDEFGAIEREADGGASRAGIPSGIDALDRHTGGIPFGIPTLVIARPGQGKTTFAMRIAWAAVEYADDSPLVYSYEDGRQSFAQRGLAQTSGVPTQNIRSRQFVQGDLSKISARAVQCFARREVIVRAAGMGVEDLCRDIRARRMRDPGKHKTVIVDYVQRMPLPKMYGSASTTDRIGEISNRLTDMAATEEVAFVLCSQLNREIEKRGADDARPKLSDIRGSGSLEQDGKLILGLYRDDPSSSKLEILVLKNHNGAAGTMAEAFWHLPTHTICNHPGDLPWLPGRD